ncbi:MAG TPA: winged helix-turn-helix domain-containing protein [Bradyrhizobium sp.]|nr:winged helix-turn-helix domain-containing protein [Bradyrhizobium sp.]
MMPVIRISEDTYARMKRCAEPLDDTADSVIARALTALEMLGDGLDRSASMTTVKRTNAPKLPQKVFRVPLLMVLLRFGGKAQAKDVRRLLGPIMAPKLTDGDLETVSTGDPRWWNAACWERSELIRDGLMRDDSERGVWEISDKGKGLAASLHGREGDKDRMIAHGTLQDIAERYWRRPVGPRPFVMAGEVVFDPVLLRRVDELVLYPAGASCLKNEDIVYVGDLVQRSEVDLLCRPGVGRKVMANIEQELAKLGLKLGMNVPGGPLNIDAA